jgi:hypothetical protein
VREVTSSAELDAVFGDMGPDGHIILGDGSNFVQVAWDGESALVQYREGDVMHQAIDPVSLPAAQQMLQGYVHGDVAWKSAAQWEVLHEDADGDSIEQGRSRFAGLRNGLSGRGGAATTDERSGRTRGGNGVGDMLANEAVRAARRGAGRLVRRGIRRFLG